MIKKINPIAIATILAIMLIVMFLSIQTRKNSIQNESTNLASFEAKAKSLYELKKRWKQSDIISKLNSIIPNSKLKENANIKKQGNKAIMNIKGIDKNSINIIVKNLFTQPFEIKKFSINRIDDKNLELQVEVKL